MYLPTISNDNIEGRITLEIAIIARRTPLVQLIDSDFLNNYS